MGDGLCKGRKYWGSEGPVELKCGNLGVLRGSPPQAVNCLSVSHTHSNHLKGPYLLTSNSWEYCEFGRQKPRAHSLQELGILDFHLNCPMLLMAKQAQRQEPEAGRRVVGGPPVLH